MADKKMEILLAHGRTLTQSILNLIFPTRIEEFLPLQYADQIVKMRQDYVTEVTPFMTSPLTKKPFMKELQNKYRRQFTELVGPELLAAAYREYKKKYPENPIEEGLKVASKVKYCASCGTLGLEYKKCSQCKMVHYCSQTCQKTHWPSHRAECSAKKT